MRRLIEYVLEGVKVRKEYRDLVRSLSGQIAENLALIMWARLFDPTNQNINHWKVELKGHCLNITDVELKKKNSRQSVLKEVLIDSCDFNTAKGIRSVSWLKFGRENIPDDERIDQACEAAVPVMMNLIKEIGLGSIGGVKRIIQEL